MLSGNLNSRLQAESHFGYPFDIEKFGERVVPNIPNSQVSHESVNHIEFASIGQPIGEGFFCYEGMISKKQAYHAGAPWSSRRVT